ncbi:MAG: PKD domain-containing protein, partial [bacterium]|nr:PKD domain-containing protein [bacterium]
MNRAGVIRRISAGGFLTAVLCTCAFAQAREPMPDKKSGIRSQPIQTGSPLKAVRRRIGPQSPRVRQGSPADARTDTVSLPLAPYRSPRTVPPKSVLHAPKAGTTWVRTYDNLDDESAFAIAQTSDGGYILVGAAYVAGDEDIYAVKIDANGDEEWSNTYGDLGDNMGIDVIQTSDGGYAIAGANYYDPDEYYTSDLQFYKLLPNGEIDYGRYADMYQWQEGRALLQTPDGGYALAGAVWSDTEPQDMLLMVLDSDGWLVNYEIYGTSRDDMAHSLVRMPDGSYAVAGYGELYGTAQFDALLLMIAPNWDLTWWRVFGGPQSDWAASLIRTSDGGFAMCGGTRDHATDKRDVFFIKTDSDGYEEWSRTYWDSWDAEGYGVAESLDGRFVVGGYTAPYGWGDMVIMKLEEPARKADYVWRYTYGGPDWDVGYDLIGTADGGFAMAGYTQSYDWTGGYDAVVVKTDAGGVADTGRVPPTAEFTATPRVGTYPLTVQFTDQSDTGSDPVTWRSWTFGDATWSNDLNPSHTYTDLGGVKGDNP